MFLDCLCMNALEWWVGKCSYCRYLGAMVLLSPVACVQIVQPHVMQNTGFSYTELMPRTYIAKVSGPISNVLHYTWCSTSEAVGMPLISSGLLHSTCISWEGEVNSCPYKLLLPAFG
jgi:hypothetical protein